MDKMLQRVKSFEFLFHIFIWLWVDWKQKHELCHHVAAHRQRSWQMMMTAVIIIILMPSWRMEMHMDHRRVRHHFHLFIFNLFFPFFFFFCMFLILLILPPFPYSVWYRNAKSSRCCMTSSSSGWGRGLFHSFRHYARPAISKRRNMTVLSVPSSARFLLIKNKTGKKKWKKTFQVDARRWTNAAKIGQNWKWQSAVGSGCAASCIKETSVALRETDRNEIGQVKRQRQTDFFNQSKEIHVCQSFPLRFALWPRHSFRATSGKTGPKRSMHFLTIKASFTFRMALGKTTVNFRFLHPQRGRGQTFCPWPLIYAARKFNERIIPNLLLSTRRAYQ